MDLKIIKRTLSFKLNRAYVDSLFKHYVAVKENYTTNNYEKTITSSSKFVEATLKGLHFYTTGEKLTRITVGTEITRLENLPRSFSPTSIKLLLPRVCRTIYHIASDRGGRHDITGFESNKMDAELVVTSCSYIVAELIRLFSSPTIAPDEAQLVSENIIEKIIPIVFELDDTKRILDISLNFTEQTLVLLYHCKNSKASDNQLVKWTEHSNPSSYKNNILKKLHKQRVIEYKNNLAILTPIGKNKAEEIIKNSNSL